MRCQLIPVPEGPLIVSAPIESAHNPHPDLFLSLVIPTFNEANNIAQLIHQIHQATKSCVDKPYEIIVVDDGSIDGTADIVEKLSMSDESIKIMRRSNCRGLATAVVRGWQAARGTVLAVIDGDLQHPPEVLPDLLLALNNADIVIASRYLGKNKIGGLTPFRQFTSNVAKWLARLVLGEAVVNVTDPMSGYFALKRTVVAGTLLVPTGYKILLEVLARGTYKSIQEIPFEFQKRHAGKTKVTWREYVEYLWQLLLLRKFLWHKR